MSFLGRLTWLDLAVVLTHTDNQAQFEHFYKFETSLSESISTWLRTLSVVSPAIVVLEATSYFWV